MEKSRWLTFRCFQITGIIPIENYLYYLKHIMIILKRITKYCLILEYLAEQQSEHFISLIEN